MSLRAVAAALGLAAIAGAGAQALGVPAPFLTGPALAVTLAALAGLPVAIPVRLRDLSFLSVGISMGSGVTPDFLERVAGWPAGLAALGLALAAILGLGVAMLRRGFGFAPLPALLAACPGHMSFILGLSAELRADVARVSTVQTTRLLILTLLVPAAVTALPEPAPAAPLPDMPPAVLIAVLALSAGLGAALLRLKLPAALLVAGLVVSASGHGTGLAEGGVPGWLLLPAFAVMGALIGTRFSGVTAGTLASGAAAGLAVTLMAGAVSVGAALLAGLWLDMPAAQLLVAFAPGGVETMAAMALILGADPAFVAAHHLFRILVLSLLMPILVARVRRGRGRDRNGL